MATILNSRIFRSWLAAFTLLVVLDALECAQATPPPVSPSATNNGAFSWSFPSVTNGLYRIDYTTQLTNPVSSWTPLATNYPTQGTNTRYLDTGQSAVTPAIPNPGHDPQRFYRVALAGTNTGVSPTVSLSVSSSGATAAGELTVQVQTSHTFPISFIKLYVDGEEVDFDAPNNCSINGTNISCLNTFTVNTTEWANGAHSLFAVVEGVAGSETTPCDGTDTFGSASSLPVKVNFANFISNFAFSQPLFEPSLGQTQIISATFATNTAWTLNILDLATNLVRSASGNGSNMTFNWDGTGTGGTTLPQGEYQFQLTAALAPISTTAPPRRPYSRRFLGASGTLGIAWQGHHPVGPIPGFKAPSNTVGTVPLAQTASLPFGPLKNASVLAQRFAAKMQTGGWKTAFAYGDDQLTAPMLRKTAKGGSNIFSNVNIGLLVSHGAYGAIRDATVIPGVSTFQTYLPIYHAMATNYDWVRISEMDLGSSSLRWLGVYAPNFLHSSSYADLYNKQVTNLTTEIIPMNAKLHALLSVDAAVQMFPSFGSTWASAMLGSDSIGTAQPVIQAWYYAGTQMNSMVQPTSPVVFTVLYWCNTYNDTLQNYSATTGGEGATHPDYTQLFIETQTVYSP